MYKGRWTQGDFVSETRHNKEAVARNRDSMDAVYPRKRGSGEVVYQGRGKAGTL